VSVFCIFHPLVYCYSPVHLPAFVYASYLIVVLFLDDTAIDFVPKFVLFCLQRLSDFCSSVSSFDYSM